MQTTAPPTPPATPPAQRLITETWFFPLAAAWGAIALPLFILGWSRGSWTPPGLLLPTDHAHELFFGYALAVVTGFLVNRVYPRQLVLLILLWLAARIGHLALPGSLLAILSNVAFAGTVAYIAAPRFMKAAKKWRNRLTGPLIIAICLAAILFQLLSGGGATHGLYPVLGEAVVLFALLMLYFGGRMIAPAAAGVIEGSGGSLTARVQPRIEGALMLAMMLAALTAPLASIKMLALLHGLALITAGLLALLRLARWKLWKCWRRADLIALGVGYAWLGAGLILLGTSRGLDLGLAADQATHAITVGALGTLTSNVMLRTRLLRLRVPLERLWFLFCAQTLLMAIAAFARMLAADQPAGLLLAAAAWAAALLLLLVSLLRYRKRYQPSQSG